VTEIQAGSYALMDAEYFQIGGENQKRFEDFAPALSLLTTVVSTNQSGFVTVDAGLKSLYRDGATPEVCRPGLAYDWFGDEYGKIYSTGSSALPRLGEQLRLIVSHCDPTVNLFDLFFVIEEGCVADIWPIDLRGCSQ
jgi:D-serine deaminase-like pyridoxal phosphate-dependent protein